MERTATITRTREMPEQGSPDAIVDVAVPVTDDGIQGKLLGSPHHDAGIINGASQRSRQDNAGSSTGDTSLINDLGPANLGSEITRVVTGNPARPSSSPSTEEESRPAPLFGGMSHPPASSPLHKLLAAVVRRRSPRRGVGYGAITMGSPPLTTTPPPISEVAETVLPEILPPTGSVSTQPPPSLNASANGVGLVSSHPRGNAAYPYPPLRQTSIIVSQHCGCGARRSHEAMNHHKSRPPATFACAICATRLAVRVA